MIAPAAVDHRGFIKVDEVDGRSPVERAAATSLDRSTNRSKEPSRFTA